MKIRYLACLLLISMAVFSCQKTNNVSKIPHIGLLYFGSGEGTDSIIVGYDTAFLQFSIVDGDADLGNDPNGSQKDIYVKDFRYDTGFAGYFFPGIDQSIEDPKKGIQGTCTFEFIPPVDLTPRADSLHMAVGDTTHLEVYIVDRAGHQSNHIVTGSIIIRPK
jgi:hypothetical protein